MELSLRTVREVMGLDPDIRLGLVLERATRRDHRLGGTVCSLAAAEGHRLGTLGNALLEVERARRDEHERLRALVCEEVRAHVLKGVALQAYYPPGVLRTSRDVDLLVPDEDDLWAAVAAVARERPVDEARVSMLESGGRRHWAVALNWPSPESDLDPVYAAEFLSAPFVGNSTTVPLRTEWPANPVVAHLLLIAEELFQQPLRGRDVVDIAVLTHAMTERDVSDLHRAAGHWMLAPEVREALIRVNAVPDLSTVTSRTLARDLGAAAERELARRAAAAGSGEGAAAVVHYGFSLGPALSSPTLVVERDADMTVVRCPVGGYLMVDTLSVPLELARAALDRHPGAILPG
ncbi:nucleotidyltransferase family protein [Streptomyces sp. NPDC093516]|uniref:nucleotidyltransferase family protein n=1 Tax=Streptomyces sp. NPDC093516 TaxID=3155304 RepID=UPI0034299076